MSEPTALEALRARLAAATAGPEKPKVVSLRTRQAYVPEAPAKKKRAPKVDRESIEMVEKLLARLKAGEVEGVMAIVACKGERKGYFDLMLRMPPGAAIEQEALRYLGALELMRADLVEFAEFGDAMAEAVLDEDEEEGL